MLESTVARTSAVTQAGPLGRRDLAEPSHRLTYCHDMALSRRNTRSLRPLCGAVLGIVVLAGCSSGSPGSGSDSSSSAAGPSGTDSSLAAGLLPQATFGAGYTVTALDASQVAGLDPAANLQGFTVSPPECATVIQSLSPFVRATDLAAQSAVPADTSLVRFAEVISTGADYDLASLRDLVGSCQQVSLSDGEGSSVQADYKIIDLGSVGDEQLGLRTTAVVTAGGQTQTAIGNNALVKDGDRLVALVGLGGANADDTAFVALLSQAVGYQHDKLG